MHYSKIMDFDFQSIFIIYVIIINSIFLAYINDDTDHESKPGVIILLNFLFVIIPIIIIYFFF